jgi:hypothetical protein
VVSECADGLSKVPVPADHRVGAVPARPSMSFGLVRIDPKHEPIEIAARTDG